MRLTVRLPIQMGVVVAEDVVVRETADASVELARCAARYAALNVPNAGAVDGVGEARSLFHALGIDPTRRRPSSESLLRRALKGLELPRINTLVDVGNWCSLDFLLPLGLYDLDRIEGDVELRQGGPDDAYDAIGGKTINLEGRYVLCDDLGPFGSPMTDSVRTSASTDTTRTLVLLYATAAYDRDRLAEQTHCLAERVTAACGGRTVTCRVATGQASP